VGWLEYDQLANAHRAERGDTRLDAADLADENPATVPQLFRRFEWRS